MTGFRLDKWYFDCVSSDDVVFIGYAARLRWGPLRLDYGATTLSSPGRVAEGAQSLSYGCVERTGERVLWRNDRLDARGAWDGGTPIPATTIIDGPDGRIEWECLAANAAARVTIGKRTIEGTGYAERLSMTVPPGALPFRELRWGRCISDDRSAYMVWIDMRDGCDSCRVWTGEAEAVAGVVDDEGVRIDGQAVSFVSTRPIRSENVARSVLGRLRPLVRFLPRGVRDIREEKLTGSCVMVTGARESIGTSVHEVVRWL